MRWMNPGAGIWLALLMIPILLYLFRIRPKTIKVSSLNFFKMLAKEHQESSWLRRLKRLLSFLLTIAVIMLGVGFLMVPVYSLKNSTMKYVVIVVDRSASMGARKESGNSPLKKGIQEVKKRLSSLPEGVSMLLMASDTRPEILVGRTYDRRHIIRVLDTVAAKPIEGDFASGMVLARKLAALETPSCIWCITETEDNVFKGTFSEADAKKRESAGKISGVKEEVIETGYPNPVNAGITGFQVRKLPLSNSQYEIFIQVGYTGPGPSEAKVEVYINGELSEIRTVPVKPGDCKNLLLSVTAGQRKTIEVRAIVENDMLDTDNAVRTIVPEMDPLKILVVGDPVDPFLEIALATLGKNEDINIYSCKPDKWPVKTSVDVAVFSNWLPKTWPKTGGIITINPPNPAGPLRLARIGDEGVPLDTIWSVTEDHPLLYGVATSKLSVTQTAVLEVSSYLEPVWTGSLGPVIAAGEIKGQRIAVMAFSPQHSEYLPLTASFPLLLGNAVYWSVQSGDTGCIENIAKTGSVKKVGKQKMQYTSLHSDKSISIPVRSTFVEIDRVGEWKEEGGQEWHAALLAQRETCLPSNKNGIHEQQNNRQLPVRDIASLLLLGIVAILLIECYLFHRHSVY